MTFATHQLDSFSEELASKAPCPGGGGAAAAAGAMASALCAMVGNLTVGKKRYADVEEEAAAITAEAQALRLEMLALIDADAECFEPLSKAYGIPKEDPSRPAIMESALEQACSAPLDIMRAAGRAIDLLERMGAIGSRLAISDVAAGAALAKACLQSASLNIYINAESMYNRETAAKLENEADALLNTYSAKADAVFDAIAAGLRE